jgi:IgA peptidase M64
MTTSDGRIIGTTTIVDHGQRALRWNLVIMGDGYQQTQLGQYANDVQNFVNTLQSTDPFNIMWNAINIYRIDVTSTDTGADDPTACGGTGASPRTYFDASFCNSGIRRALIVNNTVAITVANNQVPEYDMIMVIVNSTIYGGTGGSVAVFSLAPNANEIGIHEMGHTAFGFADEYEYYAGCPSGETTQNRYTGPEPSQPNVTINTNRSSNKWHDLIIASTPMPTTSNANCSQCDPQASPVPRGTVGTFEGAYYNHCGAYRPEFNCRMRALSNPFCAVCRRIIIQILDPYLPRRTWTGVQFTGSLSAGQSNRWFTFNWPANWHVIWTVVPTTPHAGAPQIKWQVQVERASVQYITYWITITNLTTFPVNIEAHYAVLGELQ